METTLEKTKKLIASLRRRKDFNNLDLFVKSQCSNYVFYFDLTGFFKNQYFNINIRSSIINGLETIEVVNTTECEEEITKLLNKFELYKN